MALAARLEGFEREDLRRALHERTVVRATLMRETLHLVTAKDYPHDAAAMAPYFRDPAAKYLPDGVDMERVVELAAHAAAALAEPLEATRCGRSSRSSSRRSPTTGSGAACARTRRSCTCPARSRTPSASGTGSSRPQPGSERSRPRRPTASRGSCAATSPRTGPSTRADLAAWTGLAVATIAPALEALEPELERLTDERGRELFDLRGAPRPPADTPAPLRLLGEWDNVLLAHADRTRMFDDETRRRVIRKNGDVLPTILLDGFVAGKWWWRRKQGRRDAGGDAVRRS